VFVFARLGIGGGVHHEEHAVALGVVPLPDFSQTARAAEVPEDARRRGGCAVGGDFQPREVQAHRGHDLRRRQTGHRREARLQGLQHARLAGAADAQDQETVLVLSVARDDDER